MSFGIKSWYALVKYTMMQLTLIATSGISWPCAKLQKTVKKMSYFFRPIGLFLSNMMLLLLLLQYFHSAKTMPRRPIAKPIKKWAWLIERFYNSSKIQFSDPDRYIRGAFHSLPKCTRFFQEQKDFQWFPRDFHQNNRIFRESVRDFRECFAPRIHRGTESRHYLRYDNL